MSDNTTLKPGDTLTAEQANALPAGSVLAHFETKGRTVERMNDGWAWSDEPSHRASEIVCDGHTLLRVGPAVEQMDEPSDDRCVGPPAPQFAVGQMVTVTQMAALPNRSRVKYDAWSDGFFLEKSSAGWSDQSGRLASSLDGPYRLIRIGPAPAACPHPEGTWEWAKVQMQAGKCVKAEGWQPKRIFDGVQHYWAYPKGPWVAEDGAGHDDRDWSRSTDWRVFPGTSAPAETPVVHMDLAEVCAALDEAIPEWRETMTVGQAVGELNLRIGLYQASEAELREKVESLTAERDEAIRARNMFDRDWQVACSEHGKALERADALAAERDTLRTENIALCGNLASMGVQRDAALARAEKAEATEREWMSKGSQIDADMDDLREQVQEWKQKAEKAEQLLTLRHAAWQPRVVVPEDVRNAARWLIKRHPAGYVARTCNYILSLTADHLPDAKQMAPFTSTHPEGTHEWAEDAMRQGFEVTNKGAVGYRQYPDGTFLSSDDCEMWCFGGMLETGWRIHTPAVAPEPLPSIAQIWARIASIEERLGDVEAGV